MFAAHQGQSRSTGHCIIRPRTILKVPTRRVKMVSGVLYLLFFERIKKQTLQPSYNMISYLYQVLEVRSLTLNRD